MSMYKCYYFAAIILLYVAGPADGGPVLFTGNTAHRIDGWRMAANGQIVAKLASGATITVAQDQLSALVDLPGFPRLPAQPLVTLTTGEIIRGGIVPAAQGNGMALQGGWPADLQIKSEDIHDIRITGVPYPRTTGVAPCVIPTNGDLVSGEIRSVTRDGVRIGSVFGDVSLPMTSIGAILMQDGPPVEDGRQGANWLVSFTDGTRIYADTFQPGPAEGMIVFRWRGQETPPRSAAEISRILSPGMTCESLGKEKSYQSSTESVLELKPEPMTGRNAAGGPLWIAGRYFNHGIGTTPVTTITINLPDSSLFVFGWVGLDTHQGQHGNASVSVRLDDKVLLDEKTLVYSKGALGFAGPCGGSKTLILTTAEGQMGPFGDYVNWCDLLALKARSVSP